MKTEAEQNTAKAINALKQLTKKLESGTVKVKQFTAVSGLGEPQTMDLDGTTWSHRLNLDFELVYNQN